MNKEHLITTAKQLQQPTEQAAKEFSQHLDKLIDQMNTYMLSRSDIEALVGDNNQEMMKDNHANHARFLESVFTNYVPEVLVDTVLWVFRAYRSRNFASTYWSAQLNGWLDIYKKNLSKDCYNQITPFYKWMQVNIPTFNTLAETDIDAPLSSH